MGCLSLYSETYANEQGKFFQEKTHANKDNELLAYNICHNSAIKRCASSKITANRPLNLQNFRYRKVHDLEV